MRVLVTGSRSWQNAAEVHHQLDELLKPQFDRPDPSDEEVGLIVVHGDASRGVDRMARLWAEDRHMSWSGVDHEAHPAVWRPDGVFDKAAGMRRNALMVGLGADVVLAFIRDRSKGSTHTARLALDAGLEVHVYRESAASTPLPDPPPPRFGVSQPRRDFRLDQPRGL